jgi:tetratricopeptide (TPR) repeat protein
MTDWQLGFQAFREGRMREAADRLQVASEEHELSISRRVRYETCAYLGAALYALGQHTDAVSAFELAFRFSPELFPPPALTMNLANAYLANGQRDMAREAVRYLLAQTPGHVEAQMLAQRLAETSESTPLNGAVLGATPESVRKYIRTLTFTTVSSDGLDPAQVRAALAHLEQFIDSLSRDLAQAQETIAHQGTEIVRYRQMEDAMIENMVQVQTSLQGYQNSGETQLSPIEILFQKKS